MFRLIVLLLILVILILILVLSKLQNKMEKQPAKESYFFSNSFSDLKEVRKLIKEKNKESCEKRIFITRFLVLVIGGAITFVTSFLHNIIFLTFYLLVYVSFIIVFLTDKVFNTINKISTACPNPECQASFMLPIYECTCGRKHTKLVPGKYGIFQRTCNCGRKIPTSFINGRGKLKAYCPVCKLELKGDTMNRQYAIPIVGGPSVGKTCYINTAVYQLINNVAPKFGWKVAFIDRQNEIDYEMVINGMKKGYKPAKTDLNHLTAYQLSVKLSKNDIIRRLYIYDIMGEAFMSADTLKINKAFSYSNGFVFMIDPLSIADFALELADGNELTDNGVSQEDFNDIFEGLINGLISLSGLKNSGVLDIYLAVVINKCDIRKLDLMLGTNAIEQYRSSHAGCNRLAAQNEVCKQFLRKYNSGSFVSLVEKKFRNVQYFTCSSYVNNDGNQLGMNVEAPLLWILSMCDRRWESI